MNLIISILILLFWIPKQQVWIHTLKLLKYPLLTSRALFDSLIKPKNPIPRDAERIHGISNNDISNAPTWPDVYNQVKEILTVPNRTVVIYNADYDVRIIKQTCGLHDVNLFDFNSTCLMLQYAKFWGVWDDYRGHYKWQKLTNAAKQQGIEINNAHRALGDCLMTLAVLNKMYK